MNYSSVRRTSDTMIYMMSALEIYILGMLFLLPDENICKYIIYSFLAIYQLAIYQVFLIQYLKALKAFSMHMSV